MKIHAVLDATPHHIGRLTDAAPGIAFGRPVPDARDALIAGYPSDEDLAAIRPGGTLVIPFSGLPPATRGRLRERPDLVVRNLRFNGRLVAEHAMALVLAVARRLVPMDASLRRGDWRPRLAPDPGVPLGGHRALVLGYGSIGRPLCAALHGLGMEVHAIRRSGAGADGDVVLHPPEALDGLLAGTRVLVVAVPHTDATDGWLDAERIARLGPNAVVVNVARAGVIDERALYEALAEGRIHGAGLDVWWRMPERERMGDTPASVHPFDALPNVVLSPHRAAHATTTEDERIEALCVLLAALRRGEDPGSRVDVDLGY